MTRNACGATAALLLLSLAAPVLGQNFFLYTPKPVTADEKVQSKEGILVREITVQKGDTLSALSRKFSGRASYFPQILLFNDIKNPHLIHIGDTLKVPVTKAESTEPQKPAAAPAPKHVPVAPKPTTEAKSTAQPVSELSLSDLKQTQAAKERKRAQRERKQAVKKPHKNTEQKVANSPSETATAESSSGHMLYDRAFAAYRRGDCKTALELFDRFLAEQPASSQAADASLYKADCYLKLSGQ